MTATKERAPSDVASQSTGNSAGTYVSVGLAALAALAAAVTVLVVTLLPEPAPDVLVWSQGRGDGSFGDLIGNGIDLAREDNPDLVIIERTEHFSQIGEIEEIVAQGTPLVLLLAGEFFWTQQLVADYPDTRFVVIDCSSGPSELFADLPSNASCIWAGDEEMGFVAGVAAALVSDSARVGFVGGVDLGVIWHLQAGFEQGVAYVDPSLVTDIIYLAPWDPGLSGFQSSTMGEAAAEYLDSRGADVIFHASGGSGWGVFSWAAQNRGENLWTIGVDVDQYQEVEGLPWMNSEEITATQDVILTSAVKRLDLGILETIGYFAETGEVEDVFVTIANGGVHFTTSGGHLDPWIDEVNDAIQAVKDGIVVIDPTDRSPTVFLFDRLLP